MKEKFPKLYKNKIDKIKSKVQSEYYIKFNDGERKEALEYNQKTNIKEIDKAVLLKKINSIFQRPDFVYKADVNIMYKNGENIVKKIVGIKDNKLITLDGEYIYIDDILDVN